MPKAIARVVGIGACILIGGLVAAGLGGLVGHVQHWQPLSTPSETDEGQDGGTLLLTGDLMLDRYIRRQMRTHGGAHPLQCVHGELAAADVVLVNLEGPITRYPSQSIGTTAGDRFNTRFTFATATAAMLADSNVDVVHTGNNHAYDYGAVGVAQTRRYARGAGLGVFGDAPGYQQTYRLQFGGTPVTLISYNAFLGSREPDRAVEHIRAAVRADRLPVVYAHWGTEYETNASEQQRRAAHAFVDAGARLVVGSHPHVVQTVERYRGVPIHYSLGNFVFDQYFSDAVRNGRLLRVRVRDSKVVRTELVPVRLHTDGRTCPQA